MPANSYGSIFEESRAEGAQSPLAARIRPRSLSEVLGNARHIGPGSLVHAMVAGRRLLSVLLSGSPGTGKTTIARLAALESGYRFSARLAPSLGVKEIKEEDQLARRAFEIQGIRTLLFVDEIHRLTRVQSDSLLSPVEEGVFTLFGATTENPWVSVPPALLSRFTVVELDIPGLEETEAILQRALEATGSVVEPEVVHEIHRLCGGDLRAVVNLFEGALAVASAREVGNPVLVKAGDVGAVRSRSTGGLSTSEHYEMTSALIKSIRASEVDAALYWLARLLVAGEDPRFIARRLVIFASEDVGMADSRALSLAHGAMEAAERIGMPEVRINLGHCVVFLAQAPKSKEAYKAINWAMEAARNSFSHPVPPHLRGTISEIESSRGKEEVDRTVRGYFPEGIGEMSFYKSSKRSDEPLGKLGHET